MIAAVSAALLLASGTNEQPLSLVRTPTIADVVPPPGAVLPTNARLAFIRNEGVTVNGVRANVSVDDGVPVLPLDLEGEAPGATVTVTCGGCDDVWTGTVGDGPDTTPVVFPADVSTRVVDGAREAGRQALCVTAPAVDEPFYWSVVQDEDAPLPIRRAGQASCGPDEELLSLVIGVGAEHCLAITAVDVAGNRTTVDTPCVFIEGDSVGACASTSRSTNALFAVLSVVALLRGRGRVRR